MISSNSNEFGIGLENLGNAFQISEIDFGNAIRHGNKARKIRKEKYQKEHQVKLKQKGLKEGPTLGKKLIDEIKLRRDKSKTTKVLRKYYHPKKSEEKERREEEPIRFKNQKRYNWNGITRKIKDKIN